MSNTQKVFTGRLKVHVKASIDSKKTYCGRVLPMDNVFVDGPIAIVAKNAIGYAYTGIYNPKRRCKQCEAHPDFILRMLAG